MVAYGLTPIWGSDQFLPSQLLQAVGQSFALSGIVFFGILHLRPQDALTFGAVLQTARLMGGEIGTAFVATLTRVREQVASNLIGQHVRCGRSQRSCGASRPTAPRPRARSTPPARCVRGQPVLGSVVRAAATTQAVMDGFVADRASDRPGAADRGLPQRRARGSGLSRRRCFPCAGRGCRDAGCACGRGGARPPVLAACRAGPDYPRAGAARGTRRPPSPRRATAPRPTPAPSPDAWWQLYNDARLDGFVREALVANQDLAAAPRRTSAAARAVLTAVRANRYPSTQLIGGRTARARRRHR